MKARIIGPDQFVTTQWSGGSTSQLYIYPEDAVFSQHDFDFRISSADFTSTESTFSDFTGYQRYLFPLQGSLWVEHAEGGQPLYRHDLAPYQLEYFLGSWQTRSGNSLDCRDFNFIVRQGKESRLEIKREGEVFIPKRSGLLMAFSMTGGQLLVNGQETVRLPEKSLYLLEEEASLYQLELTQAEAPIIFCEYLA